MDIIQWVVIIFLVVFVTYRFIPTKGITNITIQETKDKFKDKKVQFIDVRTPGEYRANHRPQFKNISLSDLPRKLIRWTKTKR